jgi:hypothetical protein
MTEWPINKALLIRDLVVWGSIPIAHPPETGPRAGRRTIRRRPSFGDFRPAVPTTSAIASKASPRPKPIAFPGAGIKHKVDDVDDRPKCRGAAAFETTTGALQLKQAPDLHPAAHPCTGSVSQALARQPEWEFIGHNDSKGGENREAGQYVGLASCTVPP